jgi:hypothetical protein
MTLVIALIALAAVFNAAGAPANAQGSPIPISFERGATSATVYDQLTYAQQIMTYSLRALVGQTMHVSLFTAANDVPLPGAYLVILDAYGYPLVSLDAWQTNVSLRLPRTQTYQIQVVSIGGMGGFRLAISVPSEIRFARGATSATLTGTVRPDRLNVYEFTARANQTITLSITSPADNVRLTLAGADGIPLVRAATMPSNLWWGRLSATQRYTLIVAQMSGWDLTPFTLYVSIMG